MIFSVRGRCVCQKTDSRKICVSPAHPVGSGKSCSQAAQQQPPRLLWHTFHLTKREGTKQTGRQNALRHLLFYIMSALSLSKSRAQWETGEKERCVSVCDGSPCDDIGLSLTLRCELRRLGKLTDSLHGSYRGGISLKTYHHLVIIGNSLKTLTSRDVINDGGDLRLLGRMAEVWISLANWDVSLFKGPMQNSH